MMAMAEPPSSSSLLPLLESLEDGATGPSEQTDVYLTIANRLSGDEGRQFLPAVGKHFSRLGKTIMTHIISPNAELSQAALHALGLCVYHSHVVSGVPENFAGDILSALCALVVKSTDKNTCTRALWVISKQNFPSEIIAKKTSIILNTLENVWTREDIQSVVVVEHEALNVIMRLLEQVPSQMGDGAVRWAKLVIPLVVHSAPKVRLRAAAAMEMGMPLLLEKQTDVAALIEPMMASKLIPELQKLFKSKNEANVLKLWPLFVRLLGKLLHRGGPFINSLLHLEELGFRSSSPNIKKIAFIAWKSLIDNFALNPEILASAKRMKLLMQPLSSISVRTESLMLTKVEVWWYLVVRLGPNMAPHFEQLSVPLLQCMMGVNSFTSPNGAVTPGTPKTPAGFSSPRMNMSLNSTFQGSQTYPSIQLLGLEMLLHYLLGPEVVATAARNKLLLSLEPLTHPFLSATSSFAKHAAFLISTVRDGFITVGKEAPEPLLTLLWKSLLTYVNSTIESAGSKKDRQGCEVLTLMLQALQSIVSSDELPADRVLVLLETTVTCIPQRVLGSASYQVGKMDVLNGTPALFLILLFCDSSMLAAYVEDERFFQCLHVLVGCGLSGPTSPLAFTEAVLGAVRRSAGSLGNKEQLWRMWSVMINPLTETITQTNEVNQGDALEHNFSAVHSALMFPVTHLLPGTPLQQATQRSMLTTWSKLYKVFARCSALVVTAEENACCEELCTKMATTLDRDALMVPSTLDAVTCILQVMMECVDFSPYAPQFQQKLKSPHTPLNWMRKKNKALGNLSTFQSLVLQCLEVFLAAERPEAFSEATGLALVSILSALFSNLLVATAVQELLAAVTPPLTLFYKQAASEVPRFSPQLVAKLEKLVGEMLCCLQSRSTLTYDHKLLALLSPLLCVWFPHKNKQLRTSVTQFWNSTFAKSVSLTYPEELRPILSQVKQKTPIILPGFEACSVPDELSGPYSSESSQLETKLSGVLVSSVGKRDSMLGRAAELKSPKSTSKPVSTKLDFGSPKPPRREVLEEEASIDFVFIPPETKERVLTEHQKEVKRTKRVDIPAMYNNLDASLDTTVFTQYTQSQEDSIDKLPTEQVDSVATEAPGKAPQEDMENEQEDEIPTKESQDETQDYVSPKAAENVAKDPAIDKQEEIIPESADASMEDDVFGDIGAGDLKMQPKESTSPNVSGSSDLVSGTPQKYNIRRQSFVTLEKYAEGKPASPGNLFTGPLSKTSNSQDATKTSPQASQTTTGTKPQVSPSYEREQIKSQCSVTIDRTEFSQLVEKSEPEVKLTEGPPSDGIEDDVIPDTQTNVEGKKGTKKPSTSEEIKSSSHEEESSLDDSQCSDGSPGERRRSGRQRVRPLLPGEDPKEREDKYRANKRGTGEEHKNGVQKTSPADSHTQGRPNTRSKHAAEEESGTLRTRSRRDTGESSQTGSQGRAHKRIKLYSGSQELLGASQELPGKDGRKRRTTRDVSNDSTPSTDTQSDNDNDSQSQSRLTRRSKSAVETDEESKTKQKIQPQKEESSQTALQGTTVLQSQNQSQRRTGRRSKVLSNSEEFELKDQTKKDEVEPSQSESQIGTPSQIDSQSQGRASRRSKLVNESEELIKDKRKRRSGTDDKLSQDDSQVITPSASDSQSHSRLRRRNKASSGAESEDTTESDLSERPTRANSRATPPVVSQTEGRLGSRARKRKVEDEQSKSSNRPSLTQESSQSLDTAGSTESSQSRSNRYSRLRSSQANLDTSESDSSDIREDLTMPKKRGRKRVSLPSPLILGSGECKVDDIAMDDSESSLKADLQSTPTSRPIETKTLKEDSVKGQDINVNEKSETNMDVKADPIIALEPVGLVKVETENTKPSPSKLDQELESKCSSPCKREKGQRDSQAKSNIDHTPSQESDIGEMQAPQSLDSDEISAEQHGEKLPCELPALGKSISDNYVPTEPVESLSSAVASGSSADTLTPSGETIERLSLQVSQSSEEKAVEEIQPFITEKQMDADSDHPEPSKVDGDSDHPEPSNVLMEDRVEDSCITSAGQNQLKCPSVLDELPEEDKVHVAAIIESQDTNAIVQECQVQGDCKDIVPLQEAGEKDSKDIVPLQEAGEKDTTHDKECEDEEETQIVNTETHPVGTDADVPQTGVCDAPVSSETNVKDVFHNSPVKQKDLEAVMGADVGQSPSGCRGTWSPSASPSTSILKKGQKRPLEEETTPSPLVQSRRVSFANPIHHQELADDIDRRSPAMRTSSPKRSKLTSGIPQPKYVTTPTKGPLILSPRNLRSPGYKSSKKCLISEMSQEPRPIPKDCVYPALVGCSTPVEAVLPQITSNVWNRGFGQLVRAKNIKTVGDLSALTPSDIKTLPIRSPKVCNVKKALKAYHEQQHKGRGGGDELKSFDEMEKMTSELEENIAPQNNYEEDKSPGTPLATELVDDPVPLDSGRPEQDGSGTQPGERGPEGGLLAEVEALTSRMMPLELNGCSSQQLLQLHDRLGGMMRSVVVELQTRLCQTEGQP